MLRGRGAAVKPAALAILEALLWHATGPLPGRHGLAPSRLDSPCGLGGRGAASPGDGTHRRHAVRNWPPWQELGQSAPVNGFPVYTPRLR